MKRILLAAIACLSLLVALPALSAAHSSGHHRGVSHRSQARNGSGSRNHNRNHSRRLEHFNSPVASTGPGTAGAAAANTIQSLQNGVLTIKLADGSTVSGMVTADTQVSCETMTGDFRSHDGGSGSSGSGDQGDPGDQGDQNGNGDNGDNGDQNNDPSCMSALQTAGTTVRDAELSVSTGSAVWRDVELGL